VSAYILQCKVILNIIIKQNKKCQDDLPQELDLNIIFVGKKKGAKPKAPLCDVWMIFI